MRPKRSLNAFNASMEATANETKRKAQAAQQFSSDSITPVTES